jgi:hypothetical protein
MGAGATPAGWYPDAERPGGERYWNGAAWTEERRPAAVTPPAPTYGAPTGPTVPPAYGAPQGYQAYGAPGAYAVYPKSSNAGLALGLSIGGFVCCGLIAIPGLIMGRNEVKAIDAGQADPSNRGLALAAYIVGGIVVALNLAVIIFYLVVIVALAGSSA